MATREAANKREHERVDSARDIGAIPAVVDPARRKRCRKNLKSFCSTYLKARFFLRWSASHLSALEKLQGCGLKGGKYAFAMPRGSGKTALSEATALWALLYGHRRYVLLVGAEEQAAKEMLDGLKITLDTNALLLGDFPEVCFPLRALQGEARRCGGQTVNGERTRIKWTDAELVFPTIPESAASGSRLRVAGLTGRLRGQKYTNTQGEIVRPDFVIVDDPQTDESARSPMQNNTREKLVSGTIQGLAGPKRKIAVVMPMTVIYPGDISDRFLDRDRHPQWQGERSKLMPTFPSDLKLWEEYARIRKEGIGEGGDKKAATDYYRTNRAAMDAGAVVSWPERFDEGQVSGVQYGMDLWIDDPQMFFAEYQNEPQADLIPDELPELTTDEVLAKLSRLPRGIVPREATRLTCGIDVQQTVLYWMVTAWHEDFGGSIVDYGCWPRQPRAYFAAADARPCLADLLPGAAESATIYAGLTSLLDELAGRPWFREGDIPSGAQSVRIERLLIDAGWGQHTSTVYDFCRKSAHSALLWPSHGRGITAHQVPMDDSPIKPGERKGHNWRLTPSERGKGRHVAYDANAWKSFVLERLRTPPAGKGCFFLPGALPAEHQMLADHLTSEFRTAAVGRGRTVAAWSRRPTHENHWWDCLVLATVAAAVQGLVWSSAGAAGMAPPPKPRKERIPWSEVQRRKAAGQS